MRGQSFREAEARTTDSWIWKSIVKHRDDLVGSLCYQVRTGHNIDALRDPWVGSAMGFKPTLCEGVVVEQDNFKVSDLIISEGKRWDEAKLQNLFTRESVEAILQLCLPTEDLPDKLFWPLEATGEFSVKSVYRTLVARRCEASSTLQQGVWKELWSLKMHKRLKLLLWKVAWEMLPTKCKVAERLGNRMDNEQELL